MIISMPHKVAAALVLFASPAVSLKLQPDQSCPILTLLPFSDLRQGPPEAIQEPGVEYYGFGHWPTPQSLGKATYSHMAAAQLAKEHFNKRDTSIVPELADDLYQQCSVTLPDMWYLDSGYNRSLAVDQILYVHEMALLGNGVEPCAVVGPVEPRVTEGVSVISQNMGIPQLIYQTIDRRLTRTQDFPSLGRTIVEARHFAVATAEYLQRPGLERNFVAIIYDFSDYGEQFEDPLEDEEDRLKMFTLTEHIVEAEPDSLYDALGVVKEDGYRTVVLVTERPAFLRSIATVAVDLGIVGDDWFWAISAPAVNPHILPTIKAEVDSPLDMLLSGAMVYTDYDHFIYEPEGDKFLQSWRAQGGDLVRKLNQMHPLTNSDQKERWTGGENYFINNVPAEYASFIYDSVMLIGMSACQLLAKQAAGEPIEVGLGGDHSAEIFNTVFTGASGKVMFDTTSDTPNSRSPNGDGFGVYNIRPGPTNENGERGYEAVLTSLFKDNKWVNVDGEEFLFHDGTPNQPMPLATIFEENYLSSAIRIVGFVLMGLAMLVGVGTLVCIFLLRKARFMLASQPVFLYMLCFGSILVSLAIVFISFDENSGWDEDMLSLGCSIFPWLFVLGYLIQYCALYSKLWRINKLLSLRRQLITASQAMWPFAILITACLVVLITWQAVDPLEWVRVTLEDVEPRETYGECTSENARPYLISLACLIAFATTMTLYIAWQTKGVQEELVEASWIFYAIFLHLQIWVVGLPTFIILDDQSADAAYLIRVFLAFFFAITIPVLVIWPKFYRYYLNSKNREEPKTPRIAISTTPQHHSNDPYSGGSLNDSNTNLSFRTGPGESALTSSTSNANGDGSTDVSAIDEPVLTAQVSHATKTSNSEGENLLMEDSESEHLS